MARRYALAVDVEGVDTPLARDGAPSPDAVQRLWTEPGELEMDGKTYRATNALKRVDTGASGQVGGAEQRMGFVLHAPTPEIRRHLRGELGAARVTARPLLSTDEGRTWTPVERAFTGRVGEASTTGDEAMIAVVDSRGDPFRQNPRYWSDAAQRSLFAGDSGLQNVAAIERGVHIGWPFDIPDPGLDAGTLPGGTPGHPLSDLLVAGDSLRVSVGTNMLTATWTEIDIAGIQAVYTCRVPGGEVVQSAGRAVVSGLADGTDYTVELTTSITGNAASTPYGLPPRTAPYEFTETVMARTMQIR